MLSERALCREGTARLLERKGWHITECGSLAQLAQLTRSRELDVVIVDVDSATVDVYTYLTNVRALVAGKIIAIGSAVRASAIDADITPVVDGDGAALLSAITSDKKRRTRASLWATLTPRQREVLRWLAIGLDNKAIGNHLGIGERAVKAHVTALLALFDLTNRTQLALLAHKAGYRPSLSGISRRRVA